MSAKPNTGLAPGGRPVRDGHGYRLAPSAVWRALSWVMAVLACHAAALAHGGLPQLPELTLPPGSRTHELARHLRLNGVAVAARVLDIALPIDEAAPVLAAQFPTAPAILRDDNQVVLVAVGAPWLLTLAAHGRRTLGVLSVLAPSAAGVGSIAGRERDAGAAPGWLPSGVEQRFEMSTHEHSTRTAQRIFVHPRLSPSQLARQVFAGLVRQGWASDQAPGVAMSVWQRGTSRLTLSIVRAGNTSGMFAVSTDTIMSRHSAVSTGRKHE